jgi:polar amino acid transport system ATP-binding protein
MSATPPGDRPRGSAAGDDSRAATETRNPRATVSTPPSSSQESAHTTETTPIVSIRDVHKSFGQVEVLKGMSMDVPKGDVVCIIGPSGSGKSTLLRCINALLPIDRGSIRVARYQVHTLRTDEERLALRREVSIVFQQYNLFPHKTAIENVMMAPIHVLREPRAEVRDRAIALLKKVGLAAKQDSYPGELSGGQQQRVAIARALAMRPEVMLFDEITAALDPETVKEVLNTIRELAAEGMTCMLVTHEMRFAREIADTVYFTDGGVIVESGPPAQLFDHPVVERTRAFLSQIL